MKHSHLICFDSDGTIMNTMNLKHRQCFGTAFVDVFDLANHSQAIINHWAHYNLFTKDRGINRFMGLYEIMQFCKSLGYSFEEEDILNSWIFSATTLSNGTLKNEIEKYPTCSLLQNVLIWSERVNEMVSQADTNAFENAIPAIQKAAEYCDLVGVSSAVKDNVEKEWASVGIMQYFQALSCQEQGHKTDIIKSYLSAYDAENILMVGDAPGDYQAAKKNGVKFFPIMPGDEENSWIELSNHVLDKFTQNLFDSQIEEGYINEFERLLA